METLKIILSISILMGVIFGFLGGIMAYLITFYEYKKHFPMRVGFSIIIGLVVSLKI